MNQKIRRFALTFASLFLFLACSSSPESDVTGSAPIRLLGPVSLAEVQKQEGCLDLEAYARILSSFPSDSSVLGLTSSIRFSSEEAIRPNFKLAMTYGNFVFGLKPFSTVSDFRGVHQDACKSLSFQEEDGTETVFQITSSPEASSTLAASNENGETLQATWLSPTRMRLTRRTAVYDLPCGTDSPVFMEETKILDWGGEKLERIDPLSPFGIDSETLTQYAEAVAFDSTALFEHVEEDSRGPARDVVVAARLEEMLTLPPRPDLISCQRIQAALSK